MYLALLSFQNPCRQHIPWAWGFNSKEFNDRSAYVRTSGERKLYLFWSREFGDWKLSERLDDDGACIAFLEDRKGKMPPWLASINMPQWRLWDPKARRFVAKRMSVQSLAEDEDAEDTEYDDTGVCSDALRENPSLHFSVK